MRGPHILHFETGDSLLDINSVAVIAGYSWGRISVPVVPLNFSEERIASSNFSSTHYRGEDFYNNCFSGSDLVTQAHFYDRPVNLGSNIDGVVIGLGLPDDAVVDFIKSAIIDNVVGNLPLTYSQSSTNPLIYGMNGHDTFSLNTDMFRSRINFCVIQVVMGAIFEGSLSLLLMGPFRDMGHCVTLFDYLWQAFCGASGVAIIPSASVGLILEGADAKVLFT